MKNKITSTLKSNSGASIIFVLCTLLFVMIIGISVLVASSATAGAATDSQTLAKAELYSDSLIKTFTKALKDSLGKEIVIKTANDGLTGDDASKPTGFSPEDLTTSTVGISNLPEKASYTVTATIAASANNTSLVTNYSFIPEVPEIAEITGDDGSKISGSVRAPSVLTMTLEAVVNTTVEYSSKRVSVNSTYICDGIEIYDNASDEMSTDDDFGEWRLIKIEKVE